MGVSGGTDIQDEAAARKKAVRAALTGDRSFRWLLGGGIISMLGDQFTLIATPWLVLALTGDPVVLGTVLGVMNLPRAVFILVGGAIVDRYSPKSVLMLTKYANALLLGLLAALVLSGGVTVALFIPWCWPSVWPAPSASLPAHPSCRGWWRVICCPPPTA